MLIHRLPRYVSKKISSLNPWKSHSKNFREKKIEKTHFFPVKFDHIFENHSGLKRRDPTKKKIYTRYLKKNCWKQENHKFWTFCLRPYNTGTTEHNTLMDDVLKTREKLISKWIKDLHRLQNHSLIQGCPARGPKRNFCGPN